MGIKLIIKTHKQIKGMVRFVLSNSMFCLKHQNVLKLNAPGTANGKWKGALGIIFDNFYVMLDICCVRQHKQI